MRRSRRRRAQVVCALSVLSWGSGALAQDGGDCPARRDTLGWFVPDYAKLQTGGYVGFVTVGTGYTFLKDVLDVGVAYGWVPAAVGEADVHAFALRAGARVKGVCLGRGIRWVYLVGGLGALFTFGDGFFLLTPDRYGSSGYYQATAMRNFLTFGTELLLRREWGRVVSAQGVYVELTLLDQYARAWLFSTETIPIWELFSSSFGYRLEFR